jgi:release factor glutamine methyltransferase
MQTAAALSGALGLDSRAARLEAQILLGHALGKSRAWLVAHDGETPAPRQTDLFHQLLERRQAGEPVAYLLGEREFFGLPFRVTPAVLIPRPETELLVELALLRLPIDRPARVLDLGTGSGAIAIAIARHRPLAKVTAVELSAAALEVACTNAARLGVLNIDFRQGSWFSALAPHERFEIILSNPPYIATSDPHLTRGDVRFEPVAALVSGADGLDDIRAIASGARNHLTPGGWLMFEHGYDQGAASRALLDEKSYGNIASADDLAGIARVTMGEAAGLLPERNLKNAT